MIHFKLFKEEKLQQKRKSQTVKTSSKIFTNRYKSKCSGSKAPKC